MNAKKNKAPNITKSQKDFAPDVPEQTVIDTWPKLQRKPALNADELKHFENANKSKEWIS